MKYKIRDLLLTYENNDCRFAVINKSKTKIKILTKDEIHFIDNPVLKDYIRHTPDFDVLYDVYAYETKDGINAFPVCLKVEDLKHILYDHGYTDAPYYKNQQITKILYFNRMSHSQDILDSIFNDPDKFIDVETIRKIEKAINTAEYKNEFKVKHDARIAKQIRQNQEDEKTYSKALEF